MNERYQICQAVVIFGVQNFIGAIDELRRDFYVRLGRAKNSREPPLNIRANFVNVVNRQVGCADNFRSVGNDVVSASAAQARQPNFRPRSDVVHDLHGNFNRVDSPARNFFARMSAAQSADINRNVRVKFGVGADVMEFAPKFHVDAAGTARDDFAEAFRITVD